MRVPDGQSNPTTMPRLSSEEAELVGQAYDRYASDSRAGTSRRYEAFSDAVVFALRRAAVQGVSRIYGAVEIRDPEAFDAMVREAQANHRAAFGEKAEDGFRVEKEIVELKRARQEAEERAAKAEEAARMEMASPGTALLKSMRDVGERGWEYELSSTEPWRGDDGELLRIGGHEATVRVPHGPEVTVVAQNADAALAAAMRGALSALAHQS
jgi:hypothetical protein